MQPILQELVQFQSFLRRRRYHQKKVQDRYHHHLYQGYSNWSGNGTVGPVYDKIGERNCRSGQVVRRSPYSDIPILHLRHRLHYYSHELLRCEFLNLDSKLNYYKVYFWLYMKVKSGMEWKPVGIVEADRGPGHQV